MKGAQVELDNKCKPLVEGGARTEAAGARRGVKGRAVQVDPMKPTLKPPRSKRLKLEHEKPLSSVAFNFNLRRYMKAVDIGIKQEAGAYTRPLFSST
jgi:hypothetical protein